MICRSCKGEDVVEVINLGEQYLSDFRTDDKKPPKYPLDLMLCKTCYFVQLKEHAPFSEMYTPRYGFKSGVNNTIKADLADIVQQTKKYVAGKKYPTVIDIGANDGTLLSNFDDRYYKVGVEPVEKLAKECEHHADIVINQFYNSYAVKEELSGNKADIITSVSMFYDVDDPALFVKEVAEVLDPGGVWIIQQNYLLATLEQTAMDNICHEHIGYHSLLSMEHLLDRFDLEVVDVSTSIINGGSIRTVVQFKGTGIVQDSVQKQRDIEKAFGLDKLETYVKFEQDVKKNMTELRALIDDLISQGKTIYIYGASTRGGTIWQYAGLDHRHFKYAVERNPEKVGKIIASIGVPIISEEKARRDKPDYLFVSPWFFKPEFMQREKEYLKGGGHFIFPLPKLEII